MSWTAMFDAPLSCALWSQGSPWPPAYQTNWSVREYTEVYDTGPGVSLPELRAARNFESGFICQNGAMHSLAQMPWVSVKPWPTPAIATRWSTSWGTSGQNLIAHRGSRGPWLKPTTSTLRRERSAMNRMAWTTYSAETWIPARARAGRFTAQTS